MNIIHGIGNCVGYVAGGIGSFFNRVAEYCCPTKSKPTKRVQTDQDVIYVPMEERQRNISIPTKSEWRLTQPLKDLQEYIDNAYVVITGNEASPEEKKKKLLGLVGLLQHKDENVRIEVLKKLDLLMASKNLDADTATVLAEAFTKYVDNYSVSLERSSWILERVLGYIETLANLKIIQDEGILRGLLVSLVRKTLNPDVKIALEPEFNDAKQAIAGNIGHLKKTQ